MPRTFVYDAGGLAPDVCAVDALARLHLAARRRGFELRLTNASVELQELIAFAGLREVLRVEVEGKAEQREQGGRVQEEGEFGDAAV